MLALAGWYWTVDNSQSEPYPELTFNLTNKNTGMPFLMAPSCAQGAVNVPGYDCTTRRLLAFANGGIIGAIAPTMGSEQHENGYVLNRFNDLIFQDVSISYGEIFKTIKEEMTAQYPVMEYYNNGLTYFGDPSLTPSIYKHRGGPIRAGSITWWSGNFVIDASISISGDGQTSLHLLPGTKLFFQNNRTFTVNGTLYATGTSSNKISFNRIGTTGTWGYLKFDGSMAINSTLSNVEVRNGLGIQCLNGADITIQNSLIDHCNNSIYIFNSEPQIISNTILDPTANGIYGEAAGLNPVIKDNVIENSTYNMYNYPGIYFYNNSNPFISHNDVQRFGWGTYIGGGSVAYFTDENFITPSINNRFANNRWGITSAWGSTVIAGASSMQVFTRGRNNSLSNNNIYDAEAKENSRLYALYNYWGTDGAQTSVDGTSFLDASYPLHDDPWAGLMHPDKQLSINNIQSDEGNGEDSVLQCISLEIQHKIPQAVVLCKRMLENNSHTGFVLSQLIKFKYRYNIQIKNYLDSLIIGNRPFKAKVLLCLAGIALKEKHYVIAIGLLNRIINEFPDSRTAVNALFEKFFAVLFYAKDRTLAGELLSQLQLLGLTDEDFLMRLDMAENLYNSGGEGMLKSIAGNSEEEGNNIPKEYSLLGNYPNPFNPTTNIKYALPYHSNVDLTIYDILGREVKSFNISSQTPGYQIIQWNGKNNNGVPVASGIYLYRIFIKSLENDKSFIKTAKLMLLK